MIGQLDETFYRSKRAAILSSLSLIAATFTSVNITKDGQVLNAFHVNNISNLTIVVVLLLVCVYLNVSYFLLYKTEIPQWIRDPEAGMNKVEELTTILHGQGLEAAQREQIFGGALGRHSGAIEKLEERMKYGAPPNPGPSIEEATAKRFGKVHGPIYTGVFNEVSGALRADSSVSHTLTKNINWETITNKAIEQSSRIVHTVIVDETRKLMTSVHQDIQKYIEEAKESSVNLASVQKEVLEQVHSSNQKVQKAVRELRLWMSIMNVRLVGQFFYLPMSLFILASVYAVGSLAAGKPLQKLFFE